METYAFASQKGGVGKTVALGLAAALASQDVSALLIDLDPQASATKVLGVDVEERHTVADVPLEPERFSLRDVVVRADWVSISRRRKPRSRRGSRGARWLMSSFFDGTWSTWSAMTSRWWTVRRASAC